MTDKYDIVLYNNKVQYFLTITRNITVLIGNSGSGKSELIRLLSAYNSNPSSSGITLICDKKCAVLNEENWLLFTGSFRDTIFFVDEGNLFLKTKAFADTVKGADNYFVIITREKLSQLPYSIDEIYGLREGAGTGKYHGPRRVYNEMYRVFGTLPAPPAIPDLVITEDSNSGCDFFSILFPGRCIGAGGKSNVKRVIALHRKESILAVVDGAAFGSEVQECLDMIYGCEKSVSIFAPESFEYLILQSGIIVVPKSVTEETWNHADSVRYFSWEDFYTHYLSDTTRNSVQQYSKAKLGEFYRTEGNVNRIVVKLGSFVLWVGSRKCHFQHRCMLIGQLSCNNAMWYFVL